MFRLSQKVMFKHCDPAGIVFYPRYFEMINDLVERWFDAIGHPFETLHKSGGVPTAAIEVAFKAPSRHGDQLEWRLTPGAPGGASLALAFEAVSGEETRLTGRSTLVHVGPDGRPLPWPDELRAAIEKGTT